MWVNPLIYDPKYISFVINYCKEHKIDMVISLFDVDLPILYKNKKKFQEIGVKVIVSEASVIDICNDKLYTYLFLIENGFYAPKTYISLEETLQAIQNKEIAYPLIVKPRWGMGSIGVTQADNEEELRVFYKKSLSLIKNSYLKYESNENLNESVIIQEKLNGQEYGLDVDVFFVDDQPYVLEMNARFGGGYPFSHLAGVNLPQAIIQ